MPGEFEGDVSPQESEAGEVLERSMEDLLRQAQQTVESETGDNKEKMFKKEFLKLLESDGYTGGMYPALEEALKKRDISELVRVANRDGWL